MSEVTCPYCGTLQEINHDGGYGYEEDRQHEQGCHGCDEYFKFTTAISYDYTVLCQDEDHKIVESISEYQGDKYSHKHCIKCDWTSCKRVEGW